MSLETELTLRQVRLMGLKVLPTKEDPIVTLAFRSGLTQEAAEAFRCRDLVYAGSVPRSGVDQMNLEGEELDCEVHFSHDNMAFSAVASSVGHFVLKLEAEGPQLRFQVKLSGYAATAAELVEKVGIDPLSLTLKPNQMDLGLSEEPSSEPEVEEPDAGDDSRHLFSPVDDSQRLISPEQAADTAPAADGPSLAPAALMGGSHQKDNKKKRAGRQPIVDAEPAEEPDPFQEVVQ